MQIPERNARGVPSANSDSYHWFDRVTKSLAAGKGSRRKMLTAAGQGLMQLRAVLAPANLLCRDPPIIPAPLVIMPHVIIGDTAAAMKLRDLDHRTASLARFRGRTVLVFFWNPRCGFCRQMLPALRSRCTALAPPTPEFIVISSGTDQETRALGFNGAVSLDPKFALAAASGRMGHRWRCCSMPTGAPPRSLPRERTPYSSTWAAVATSPRRSQPSDTKQIGLEPIRRGLCVVFGYFLGV